MKAKYVFAAAIMGLSLTAMAQTPQLVSIDLDAARTQFANAPAANYLQQLETLQDASKKNINEIKNSIDQVKNQQKALQSEAKAIETSIAGRENEQKIIQDRIKGRAKDQKNIDKQIKAVNKNKALDSSVKNMQIADLQTRQNKNNADNSADEARIETIKKEVNGFGNDKSENQRKQLEAQSTLDQLTAQLNQLNATNKLIQNEIKITKANVKAEKAAAKAAK